MEFTMNMNPDSETNAARTKPLILIVDDVPQNVQILHQILNTGDYSFAIATCGKEALKLVEKTPPDLILLDIMLGDIDGFDVCKDIKKDPNTADIPIIFLTAKVTIEDKIKGFKLGAVDYITKPFEDAEVAARVRTHIRLKRSSDMIKDYNRQLNETLAELQVSVEEFKQGQEQLIIREKEDTARMLSATASHEMHQPITVIMGYLDLLKESMDPDSQTPAQQKYLERIENGLKKLIEILDKFRKSSHLYLLNGSSGYNLPPY
jgi:DNA-binding response OmpR family regulator